MLLVLERKSKVIKDHDFVYLNAPCNVSVVVLSNNILPLLIYHGKPRFCAGLYRIDKAKNEGSSRDIR